MFCNVIMENWLMKLICIFKLLHTSSFQWVSSFSIPFVVLSKFLTSFIQTWKTWKNSCLFKPSGIMTKRKAIQWNLVEVFKFYTGKKDNGMTSQMLNYVNWFNYIKYINVDLWELIGKDTIMWCMKNETDIFLNLKLCI